MICTSVKIEELVNLVLPDYVDFAEYRFDNTNLSADDISKLFNTNKIKTIAAYRTEDIDSKIKFDTLKHSLESGCDYIDLETDYDFISKQHLMSLAKERDTGIILSYHNYDYTPDRYELEEIFQSMNEEQNADIIKIACRTNSINDMIRLLELYDAKKNVKKIEKKIISLPIGNKWKMIRLACLELGAPFIYASLSEGMQTAAGQVDVKSLKTILDLIK